MKPALSKLVNFFLWIPIISADFVGGFVVIFVKWHYPLLPFAKGPKDYILLRLVQLCHCLLGFREDMIVRRVRLENK